jgi:polyisoprenoid-binding protein YceI
MPTTVRGAIRRCRLALFAALLTGGALAEPLQYRIDPAHTFPQFAVSHLGFSIHRGRFNRSSGRIELDLEQGRGRIEVTIAADSVDTGDPELEKQLLGANFLDVARYPTLRFEADQLGFDGNRLTSAQGQLTLLGITRPVQLTIDHFYCGIHPLLRQRICGANATTRIRRAEFGMGKFLSMVGDEVTITLQVEAVLESAAETTERLDRGGR